VLFGWARGVEAPVARPAPPAVRRLDETDGEVPGDLGGVVRGAVVDDDHLEVGIVDPGEVGGRLPAGARAGVGGGGAAWGGRRGLGEGEPPTGGAGPPPGSGRGPRAPPRRTVSSAGLGA